MREGLITVLVFLFAVGASARSSAPGTSGIYLTAADYKAGRLTAEGDCGSAEHKLELHDVLNKSYIHVTHGTEKVRYEKKDLFGFRACDGNDYRFTSNLEYRIMEARELYIYTQRVYRGGKTRHSVTFWYFSKGPEGDILPLKLHDVKQAFPDNRPFHEKLDQAFRKGEELKLYDRTHAMFVVNRLLEETQR